jgi:hypothetical protein
MTTVNYPSPVTVNGYSCKNCTDVDYAKKNIDPAHPKDGPFGVDKTNAPKPGAPTPAVTFGGGLAGLNPAPSSSQAPAVAQGQRLDVSA